MPTTFVINGLYKTLSLAMDEKSRSKISLIAENDRTWWREKFTTNQLSPEVLSL